MFERLTQLQSLIADGNSSGAASLLAGVMKDLQVGPYARFVLARFWKELGPAFKKDPEAFMQLWLAQTNVNPSALMAKIDLFAKEHPELVKAGQDEVQTLHAVFEVKKTPAETRAPEPTVTVSYEAPTTTTTAVTEGGEVLQIGPKDLVEVTPEFRAAAEIPEYDPTVRANTPVAEAGTAFVATPVGPAPATFQPTPVALPGSDPDNKQVWVQHVDEEHYRQSHRQLIPRGNKFDEDVLATRK